jgi:hypothetical protein
MSQDIHFGDSDIEKYRRESFDFASGEVSKRSGPSICGRTRGEDRGVHWDFGYRGFEGPEEKCHRGREVLKREFPKAGEGVFMGAFRHTGYRDFINPEDERSGLLGRKILKRSGSLIWEWITAVDLGQDRKGPYRHFDISDTRSVREKGKSKPCNRKSQNVKVRKHLEEANILKIGFFGSREDRRSGTLHRETRRVIEVIWEVVTWTNIWPRGLIIVIAISTFRYFGDREIKESRTLDINTQEVPKPKITLREKIPVVLEGRVEVKDLWIEKF